jgi:anti-anti-sigma factor
MARPAGRGFTVRQDQDGGSLLVTLTGELDIGAVELLAACADQICRQRDVAEVRLDLSGLTFLDRAGAQTLAAACHCLRRDGRRIEVTGIRARVQRVLDLLGLALTADRG